MDAMIHARRVRVRVRVNGHDATDAVRPDLLEFRYTDHAKGKADEISLTLANPDGRWSNAWNPGRGAVVQASLECLDWFGPGKHTSLPMGTFTVDTVSLSGPPDRVQVKAVSASKAGNLGEEARSRGWEEYDLHGIASEIANEHDLELMYDAPQYLFEREDQREESDLAFLHRLCTDCSVNLKVHDGRMILYGAQAADSKAPSLTITRSGGQHSPTRYTFSQASAGTFKGAEVTYHDPKANETYTATVVTAGEPPSGQMLKLNERVESAAQAIALGEGALRDKNEQSDTASLELMGHPGLVAGITVRLEGFGTAWDGTYFVEKSEHKVASGYHTSVELRRAMAQGFSLVSASSSPSLLKNMTEAQTQRDMPEPDSEEQKEAYEEGLRNQILDNKDADAKDKTILCIPHIAREMAKKGSEDFERYGWNQLGLMMTRWMYGPAENPARLDSGPYWIEFPWTLKYGRGDDLYRRLTRPEYAEMTMNIYNEPSKRSLGNILARHDYLTDTAQPFDFINAPWPIWDTLYHQYRVPAFGTGWLDGLQAALGTYALRALAKGRAEPNGDGTHTITVTSVAVFIYDVYNFDPGGIEWLAFWSCSKGDVSRAPVDIWNYEALTNNDFRKYREKHGLGQDYVVLSKTHKVENFKEIQYVFP